MTANTKLIQSIAGALIAEHGEEATEWLDGGGRANVARIVAEWSAAIEEGRWIERLEDVLVLRALRHETHWVEVLGGPHAEALVRELVDDDWRAGGGGAETATRIGEIFAHALLRGDTGEPFESIEYAFREHGDATHQSGTRNGAVGIAQPHASKYFTNFEHLEPPVGHRPLPLSECAGKGTGGKRWSEISAQHCPSGSIKANIEWHHIGGH